MSKTLIIGNSNVVIKKIEDIRQQDKDSTITLFCTESHLPYDRFLLPSLVLGELKENKLSVVHESYFKENSIEVIANQEIARVSLKRKYITTENKNQIEFDHLVIADLGLLQHLPIKGVGKKGVFDCALIKSTKEIIKMLPFVDSAFVHVTNFQGLNMACALHAHGKEVVVVCESEIFLNMILDDETSTLLKQILEAKGIRVLLNTQIEEILGDAEVKALKLSSGKVIAAQMVVFDSMTLDLRLLEGSEGYEYINDDFFLPYSTNKQWSFGFNVLDGFCIGVTKIPEGGREYLKFDGPENVFKKIYALGDVLVGAILFNAPSDKENLVKIIHDKEPVSGREEALIGGL